MAPSKSIVLVTLFLMALLYSVTSAAVIERLHETDTTLRRGATDSSSASDYIGSTHIRISTGESPTSGSGSADKTAESRFDAKTNQTRSSENKSNKSTFETIKAPAILPSASGGRLDAHGSSGSNVGTTEFPTTTISGANGNSVADGSSHSASSSKKSYSKASLRQTLSESANRSAASASAGTRVGKTKTLEAGVQKTGSNSTSSPPAALSGDGGFMNSGSGMFGENKRSSASAEKKSLAWESGGY